MASANILIGVLVYVSYEITVVKLVRGQFIEWYS
jgi:hypothetical protein